MSAILPSSVNELIAAFASLPGIGPKSASRLALYLLQQGKADVERLTAAIAGVTSSLMACQQCGLITAAELCPLCADSNRSNRQLCVVEDSLDVVAFERAGTFTGRYHVLGGVLSPIDGIGPDQLRIALLLKRVQESTGPLEIILATNPSLEGEATAEYLKDELAKLDSEVVVSRIARGLPMGSDVEYADPTTLIRALEGRREV